MKWIKFIFFIKKTKSCGEKEEEEVVELYIFKLLIAFYGFLYVKKEHNIKGMFFNQPQITILSFS